MTNPSSSTPVPPGSIVVGVDGSEGSFRAVTWAADQAAVENRPLVLLHGDDTGPPLGIYPAGGYPIETDEMRRDRQRAVETVLSEAALRATTAHPDLQVVHVLARTDAREALLVAAEGAAAVVVGSRGRGHAMSLLMGSVSASVAGRAECPVVVVRPQPEGPRLGRMMVGARFNPASLPVVEHAFAQASLRGLPLTVAHCYFDTEAHGTPPERALPARDDLDVLREQLVESVAGLSEKYPDVEVDLDLTTGTFDHVLSDVTGSYELVVIGRRSGSWLDRMIGTWSTLSIVEHATGTVVVVPESAS